jgi:glycosyltransferase involved in cell wall biosynthesis
VDPIKVAFLSFKSLLDRNSGAAMELRSVLEALHRTGDTCLSFSFNCYDVGDAYKADELIDPKLAQAPGKRELYHYDSNGVRHYLLVGTSKDTMKLTRADLDTFLEKGERFLRSERPDRVIFFGSNELLPLLRVAKDVDAKCVFYAGTAVFEQERKPLFDIADRLVVPSEFVGELYRERFGVSYDRIPTTLGFDLEKPTAGTVNARREIGTITLVNPAPDKGGHFFFHLSRHQRLKCRTFLCVESRSTRRYWTDAGINIDSFENVHWAPWQTDIRRVLRQTAVLVMPSLINEAAGKVAAEAMALGVPCLGFDIGGIREQIREGGVILPFDRRLAASPETMRYTSAVVPEPVETWAEAIEKILQDPKTYRDLSKSALGEAERFRREETTTAWKKVLAS